MDDQAIVQRVAMKAVIVRDNKVLILREASTYEDGSNTGKYHFPGGRINPGEPFAEGLKREVREETGLEIEIIEPLYVGEWFPTIKGVPNHIVAMFMICTAEDKPIVLSDEHDAYEWVDEISMANFVLMPPDDDVVRAYYRRQTAA